MQIDSTFSNQSNDVMTDRDLIKLERSILSKMEAIRTGQVTLKDSGIGGMMNTMKKADEAAYEKIFPEYKRMVADLKPR